MKIRVFFLALPIAGVLALSPVNAAVQGDAGPSLQKADELIAAGKYKEAASLCERASKLASGPCPECLLGVARAYAGAGQLPSAIQVTRMAIPLLASSPADQAKAYVQLGALLVQSGARSEESDDAFRRAVALDGTLAGEVRAQLAEALLLRARHEAARQQPPVNAEVVVPRSES
ncbi:MAG TPA: tetratricopeptide repeat protein [Thermoanaerobaculia bacterium]|nr:tetratricopeptide repeat protein [Thermoanaerobaculia bacterium]